MKSTQTRCPSRHSFSRVVVRQGSLVATRQCRRQLTAQAAFAPPPVSVTKDKFLHEYDLPIPGIYNTVVQELLVQHHFIRWNKKYQYDKVFALGIVSVFNQILDDLEEDQRTSIFSSYIKALDEDAAQYRRDAEEMEKLAEQCTSASDLTPDGSGNGVQQVLANIATKTEAGEFFYTKFFAIGLFRLLELTNSRDPKALEGLVKGLGVRQESVNRDLLLYKGILSKMSAAKELMKDFLEREKRKQEERNNADAKKEEVKESEEKEASPPVVAKADAET